MSDETTIKPGKKTSEHFMTYFMTTLAVVVGTIFTLELPEESPFVKIAAFLGPILASMGYTFARTKAKQVAKGFVFVIMLPILLVSCTCALEKQALEELDDSQDLIFVEYMELVEKEYAGSPDKIENRKELVSSVEGLLDELKKQTE